MCDTISSSQPKGKNRGEWLASAGFCCLQRAQLMLPLPATGDERNLCMACSWSQATDVDRTKVFHATCMNALCSHLFSSPLGCFHSLFALLRNTSCCMMIMLETTKLSVGLYISRTGKRHPVRVLQRVLDAGSPDQRRHHRKRHEPLVEYGRRGGRQKDTNGWDKRLHAVPKGDCSVKGFPGAGRCDRVVVTR